MNDLERSFYDRQKELHGKTATLLWLAFGVVEFLRQSAARFFSWQALLYFLVGMFAAALIFGMLTYGAQRLMARSLLRSTVSKTRVLIVGAVMTLLEAVLIYFAARATVSWLFEK
jgi:hypothetical protein